MSRKKGKTTRDRLLKHDFIRERFRTQSEEWAFIEIAKKMREGVIPSDASTLDLAEISFCVGAEHGELMGMQWMFKLLSKKVEISPSVLNEITTAYQDRLRT